MSFAGTTSPGASRLKRRLHATGVKIRSKYMRFLDAHPEEYQRLIDFLTISVSSFFRSPYAFQQVARLVLPEPVSYKREHGYLILGEVETPTSSLVEKLECLDTKAKIYKKNVRTD